MMLQHFINARNKLKIYQRYTLLCVLSCLLFFAPVLPILIVFVIYTALTWNSTMTPRSVARFQHQFPFLKHCSTKFRTVFSYSNILICYVLLLSPSVSLSFSVLSSEHRIFHRSSFHFIIYSNRFYFSL